MLKIKTLTELRKELLEIGEIIGCGKRPKFHFIIPDYPDGLATPFLEIHDNEYHFIVSERGCEIERKITTSDDEILYWFTESGVHAMASHYAASKRLPNNDFRVVYFRKQYQLMLSIKPEWATRKRIELAEIIQKHPFDS
ncbi:Imm63 family immunity protein [Scandinavium goeteborgense]|uniref:Imm63 family immunity protein n=1 Tax=Scandinavium goeteborgense TaxID=1851514 RepID=UPI001FEB2433|nr:Imm63 family immunity protein [Scandinavium goeteborgense]